MNSPVEILGETRMTSDLGSISVRLAQASDKAALRAAVAELHNVDLPALETRPGIGVRVAGVDRPQEAVRQPVRLLKAGERIEGAREDDAAEVEEDRADGRCGGLPVHCGRG